MGLNDKSDPPSSLSALRTGMVPSLAVGDITVHFLVEIPRLLMEPEFLTDAAPASHPVTCWCNREPHRDLTTGHLVMTIQAFLLQTPERLVLVDAGVGAGKSRRLAAFHRREVDCSAHLERRGIDARDIDIVLLTHLHPDHVGGAARWVGGRWTPTFARARHLLSAAEYGFWTGPDADHAMLSTGDFVTDSVLPLRDAGLLEVVTGEREVCPGIRFVPTPGHTPGSACVAVASEGQSALLTGDLVHHVSQVHQPELNSKFCLGGVDAQRQRRRVLTVVADTGTVLIPSHFPWPTAGHVTAGADGGYDFSFMAVPAG